MTTDSARRRLTDREADIIRHLLSVEAPLHAQSTIGRWQKQLSHLVVVGRWDCCPSIDLTVAPEGPLVKEAGPPLIEARHRTLPYELLLFPSEAGDIRTVEIVHYHLVVDELPPPDEWEAPTMTGLAGDANR